MIAKVISPPHGVHTSTNMYEKEHIKFEAPQPAHKCGAAGEWLKSHLVRSDAALPQLQTSSVNTYEYLCDPRRCISSNPGSLTIKKPTLIR